MSEVTKPELRYGNPKTAFEIKVTGTSKVLLVKHEIVLYMHHMRFY